MSSPFKHCEKCGTQMHRNSELKVCSLCLLDEHFGNPKPKKPCEFCKETNCAAWGSQYFQTIGKRIFVDFRADMEANQIDCCFGTLNEDGTSDEGQWSDFAIDINYCPICGRKLPPVE